MTKVSHGQLIHRRSIILVVLILIVFSGLVVRLFVLQVKSAEFYRAKAFGQYNVEKILQPARGEIKIADKATGQTFTVATSIKKDLLYAIPKDITDGAGFAKAVGDVTGLPQDEINSRIADRAKRYVVLKRGLTEQELKALKALELPGVGFDADTARFYPENNFLSSVLGFVGYKGTERVGVYGLEEAFEEELRGAAGSVSQEKDISGAWIFAGKREITPQRDGDTIILTIDRTIQHMAEEIIKGAVTDNHADSGSIVVMDPKTGAIWAMASYPDFNPNEYNKVEDSSIFQNMVTLGSYEPGSIFKPLTMAASIDAGKISPETTYVDTGSVEIDGYTIQNSDKKAHGKQTMTQALEESLNTGSIFAKEQIGNKKFFEYLQKFGLGKPTGIELRESSGNLDNLRANILVNYHTASFGQGITVTPLQMVEAFSAIANGGKMMRPYIVQTRITGLGDVVQTKPVVASQVISRDAASKVGGMMVAVVENGHGKRAQAPGYYVAGKTGTAQVSKKDGRGYEDDINIGSFIGFAPAEDPKFVALVRVNHPRNVLYAESTAAPAFGKLAQFILNYLNVPPNREVGK